MDDIIKLNGHELFKTKYEYDGKTAIGYFEGSGAFLTLSVNIECPFPLTEDQTFFDINNKKDLFKDALNQGIIRETGFTWFSGYVEYPVVQWIGFNKIVDLADVES